MPGWTGKLCRLRPATWLITTWRMCVPISPGRKPKAGLQLLKFFASSARNVSTWLMLHESGRSGICSPPPTLKCRASFTFTTVIGSVAARKYLPASPRVLWRVAGLRRCPATRLPLRRACADHERAANGVRLARRERRRARHCGADNSHGVVGRRASRGIHIGSLKGSSRVGNFGSFRSRCATRLSPTSTIRSS
jgi:hypothetical protein